MFRIPYDGDAPSGEVAKEAAGLMAEFVCRTLHSINTLPSV